MRLAMPRLFAVAVCALLSSELAVAAQGSTPSSSGLVSWAGATAALVESNAPVLRWNSTIEPGQPGLGSTAVLALVVSLHRCSKSTTGDGDVPCVPVWSWSSGEVRMTLHATWIGLCVSLPIHA
jgi:hypothetical protein